MIGGTRKVIGWGKWHAALPYTCPQPECMHPHSVEQATDLNRIVERVQT